MLNGEAAAGLFIGELACMGATGLLKGDMAWTDTTGSTGLLTGECCAGAMRATGLLKGEPPNCIAAVTGLVTGEAGLLNGELAC